VDNPYLPYPVRIDEIITETEDKNLKTFKFVFLNPGDEEKFAYRAGQFAELSVTGKGEIPIGIASSPVEKGFVKFTVNKVGLVSSHLHNMAVGDIMGIRGPMGNWYPWETLEHGKNVVIIGGGFAFTTLRSSIIYMLHPDNRKKFGDIHVIYGARTPGDILYPEELQRWANHLHMKVQVTVDRAAPAWTGHVGFVTNFLRRKEEVRPDSVYLLCGPEIMMRVIVEKLLEAAVPEDHIFLSLERNMKCGAGFCGRCQKGPFFICKDGPVFRYDQIAFVFTHPGL